MHLLINWKHMLLQIFIPTVHFILKVLDRHIAPEFLANICNHLPEKCFKKEAVLFS